MLNVKVFGDTTIFVSANDAVCALPAQSDSVTIKFYYYNPAQPLDFTVRDTVICPGTAATIIVKPRNGSGTYTYTW